MSANCQHSYYTEHKLQVHGGQTAEDKASSQGQTLFYSRCVLRDKERPCGPHSCFAYTRTDRVQEKETGLVVNLKRVLKNRCWK